MRRPAVGSVLICTRHGQGLDKGFSQRRLKLIRVRLLHNSANFVDLAEEEHAAMGARDLTQAPHAPAYQGLTAVSMQQLTQSRTVRRANVSR
jgi:hypothetical protein